jgi:hypothetical protein
MLLAMISGVLFFAGQAVAVPIANLTCDDVTADRYAVMDSAEDCWTGLGNPKDDPDLQAGAPGEPWIDVGHIEGDEGSAAAADGFLSWTFIEGQWGSDSFTGEWNISQDFWDIYSEAIISIHVGNGGGDPDHFIFVITPGDLSGILEYFICDDCKGGGFSNIVLWGRGASVPEPGTIALLGIGLLLVGMTRRRKLAK